MCTPAVAEKQTEKCNDEELDANGKTEYSSAVARISFPSQDRPDLMFAAVAAARHMSSPSPGEGIGGR